MIVIPQPADSELNVSTAAEEPAVVLWVDGGGAFLICLKPELRIGRTGTGGDLTFMAPIGSPHATLFHTGESHVIVPRQSLQIAGRRTTDPTLLRDGQTFDLAPDVRIRFATPSPLSRTAVLSFPGKVPPTPTLDAAILMTQTCLIGPNPRHHIVIPGIAEQAVLIWNGKDLTCRFAVELGQNGIDSFWGDSQIVRPGSLIAGREIRFRCEPVAQTL